MRELVTLPSGRDERGVTIILFAILMLAILAMVAIVIDLSATRWDRQDSKRNADLAASAAIQRMKDFNDGIPRPWPAICEAISYLDANGLGTLSGTYKTGAGVALAVDPCDGTGSPDFDQCVPNDATSWGWFEGTAQAGSIKIDIKSGYQMPDTSFGDTAADAGDAAQGSCDNVGVIIEKTRQLEFARVIGQSEQTTRIRSVGRVTIANEADDVLALLLLERTACGVVQTEGNSNALVKAAGYDSRPGLIHADSTGTQTPSCNSQKVFDVGPANPSTPRIRADASVTTGVDGQISTRAMGPAGNAANAHDPCQTHVAIFNTNPSTNCVVEGGLLGRGPVDQRYRIPMINLRTEAAGRVAWTNNQAAAAGFAVVDNPTCSVPATSLTVSKLFVRCDNYSPNADITFSNTEVVFTGRITVPNNRTYTFNNPRTLYVGGNANQNGVAVSGTLKVNSNNATDANGNLSICDDRLLNGPRTDTTKFVLMNGPFSVGGTARLCSTTLFLADNTASSCPLPSTDGVAPYGNSCNGDLDITGGSAVIDWSGPNQSPVSPTAAEIANLEDLAFWTESSDTQRVTGGGAIIMRGIVFAPNTDPMRLGGNGTNDVTDAQILVRKLVANGNAQLILRPDPANVVPFAVFKDSGLVR